MFFTSTWRVVIAVIGCGPAPSLSPALSTPEALLQGTPHMLPASSDLLNVH